MSTCDTCAHYAPWTHHDGSGDCRNRKSWHYRRTMPPEEGCTAHAPKAGVDLASVNAHYAEGFEIVEAARRG